MPKNKILLLILLFTSAYSGAQSIFTDRLEGRVINEGKGISDVHVMNTSRSRATITNANGEFAITASVNDTILFSAVQYKKKTIVVNSSMLESIEIIITLEDFVNELDEVVLRPYDLSGDLARDMGQMNTGQIVTASTLGLPNAYAIPKSQPERHLYEATSGSGLVPLNPIINAISGRTKYLKKVLERERKYARTDRVREFYADSLFVQELKIPEAKIDDFMFYCEVDYNFSTVVDTHDRLKIWEYLKMKSTIYRENNELD